MMSPTDVPNSNISFLRDVRQVVLTPLLCQLTQLSSFVLPAQRRTNGCRAILWWSFGSPRLARFFDLFACQIFSKYSASGDGISTISKCTGFFRRVETESPHSSDVPTLCRRVETDSTPGIEGLLLIYVSSRPSVFDFIKSQVTWIALFLPLISVSLG